MDRLDPQKAKHLRCLYEAQEEEVTMNRRQLRKAAENRKIENVTTTKRKENSGGESQEEPKGKKGYGKTAYGRKYGG